MRRALLALVALALLTPPAAAVPVRSQTMNPDGFTIVTSSGDSIQAVIVFNNPGFTLSVLKNGVQTASQFFSTANNASFESFILTNVGALTGSGPAGQGCVTTVSPAFQLAVHFVSSTPLVLKLLTANCGEVIASGWWSRAF